MISDNSAALILRNIQPGSTVLEFGCAHGRMTKYMKETLGCNVSIIERDFEAGSVAAKYAHQALIGTDGDISNSEWETILQNDRFDYIVFADVLEHLYEPETILKAAKRLLSPSGSIWVSIPNVSYNGILIDLMNDQFQYREIGLLDNTHIRFFTSKSLTEMVNRCGLQPVKKLDPKNAIQHAEFKNSYEDVPPEVAKFLQSRQDGETYQFVWELQLI